MMNTRRFGWVPPCAIALLAIAGCKRSEAADPKHKDAKDLVFTVDAMPVEAKKVDYKITAPGEIDAFEQVQVTARVAGAVDRVAFTEGQDVKTGDVLVVIDSARYQVLVDGARAALAKAKTSQTLSEANVARREAATKDHEGLIPKEELESYRTQALTAKADTDVALENLRTAQLNLRDAIVRAPMSGTIQSRTVQTGQYVQPGYVMATLIRNDPMLLHFQVEPLDAPKLTVGMPAEFTIRESLKGAYTAKITLVAGAADPATHLVPVTAEVTQEGRKYWLRPGSFCDVTVTIPSTTESPLIPRTAARATDHGYVAYVVENGIGHERQLTLGMSTSDGWVQIRGGINAGDMLVVRGAEALSDGVKVKPNMVTAASLQVDAAAASATATPTPIPAASNSAPVVTKPK